MKTPKFTEAHRFPQPYANSKSTDVKKTFARERKRLKDLNDAQNKADQEASFKVSKIGVGK